MRGKSGVNNPLEEIRLSKGWTQYRLVVEIERVAKQLNIPVAQRASLKVQISRWENGGSVSPKYRQILRHIYRLTDDGLGFATNSPELRSIKRLTPVPFHENWAEAFDLAVEEWNLDLERRNFLAGVGYAAAASTSPALQWLLGQPEAIVRSEGGLTVGVAHIESIKEITNTFRKLDNRFGGGHARASIVRFLANDVAPLVKDGRYGPETGAALLSAAAEAMQLAGWMSYDAGGHGVGQRYMTQALRLALAADDSALGAEILAGLSHQASYLRDSSTAVDLARASQQTARRRGLDALVAEAAVMEAHGHACGGDEAACARALSIAEVTLDKADRSGDPQWIGYFDEAYLSAKFGHCFKELGQAKTAQRFARRSLNMNNSYMRGRAFNLALLATAHAQAGEVEAACAVGTEALTLVNDMSSVRAIGYIRSLRRELTPFATSPAVRSFDEAAAPLLAETV
jgi:transcriptional regulator with XRE-family HTH domain